MTEDTVRGFERPASETARRRLVRWLRRASSVGAVAVVLASGSAVADTFTVNSTSDAGDNLPGDGLCFTGLFIIGEGIECTLRAAIEEANATLAIDTIEFASSLPLTGAFALFEPAVVLPYIYRPLVIDGYTAPGYDLADPWATPVVNVSGGGSGGGFRFIEGSAGSVLRGVAVHGFAIGIGLLDETGGAPPDGIVIEGCHVGVSHGLLYPGNGVHGIRIEEATGTRIGRDCSGSGRACTGKGNVISGNGVGIVDYGDATTIFGNRIGTDTTGTTTAAPFGASTANVNWGVIAGPGSSQAEIGSPKAEGGNLISGNVFGGILMNGFANAAVGNRIGTDASGMTALPNQGPGIRVEGFTIGVGGLGPGEGNLISGNSGGGVEMAGAAVAVSGNLIGLSSDESTALPNANFGVHALTNSSWIEGNTIAGNTNRGIRIEGTQAHVYANVIGTNAARDPFPNGLYGIVVEDAWAQIGDAGQGNVIAYQMYGVRVASQAHETVVQGNWIGTDATGADLGGSHTGLTVEADDVLVGAAAGRDNGLGNVIGHYDERGIYVGVQATDTIIAGNYVGTDAMGRDLGNGERGLLLNGLWVSVGGVGPLGPDAETMLSHGNTIANTEGIAIEVFDGGASHAGVRGNVFFGNGAAESIDLGGDGATANDFGDNDSGTPNLWINTPELDAGLTQWNETTGELEIVYRVTTSVSEAAYPLTIDFYLESQGDGPDVYLGTDTYSSIDALAYRAIGLTPFDGLDPVGVLVATTTTASGQTSEFSHDGVPIPEPAFALSLLIGAGCVAARRRLG